MSRSAQQCALTISRPTELSKMEPEELATLVAVNIYMQEVLHFALITKCTVEGCLVGQ